MPGGMGRARCVSFVPFSCSLLINSQCRISAIDLPAIICSIRYLNCHWSRSYLLLLATSRQQALVSPSTYLGSTSTMTNPASSVTTGTCSTRQTHRIQHLTRCSPDYAKIPWVRFTQLGIIKQTTIPTCSSNTQTFFVLQCPPLGAAIHLLRCPRTHT